MMTKKRVIIFCLVYLFYSCTNSPRETEPAKPVLNTDSLNRIAVDMKKHRELVHEVFCSLQLDSLSPLDGEAYRFIMKTGWGPSPMVGSPLAITFYKKTDTAFVVIQERRQLPDTAIYKWTKYVSFSRFDSVRAMFDSAFWQAPVTDFNCDKLNMDGNRFVWEAHCGKRHKLKSQRNCTDKTVFKNSETGFFELAEYSIEVLEDLKWYRENPPCCVKSSGPPSELRKKKR